MALQRLTPNDLRGKIIDIHSHVGVSLKAYACREYPYAATIEGIAYRQMAAGVDVNVVFPFSPDLFFDPARLTEDLKHPAARPLSPSPYATENELLLREVYDYCPEFAGRFLPFLSVDPERRVHEQVRLLESLANRYPVYGIKIAPVICQAPITALLDRGKAVLELARDRSWPILLHTTSQEAEEYSNAAMTFRVVEKHPEIRFCLAHAIGFHRDYLRRADEMPHVWVDTSALKIQVQAAYENQSFMASPAERLEADYSDHRKVMRTLMDRFPDTIIWGSDTPAYSYITRRKQAEGVFVDFRLKASYFDEIEALKSLPPALMRRASNLNSLEFLFG